MKIGKPVREIVVEPLELPEPLRTPQDVPTEVPDAVPVRE